MQTPHPIPYQGSKRGLASAILRWFPSDKVRLIEPFAGSAAVSLAASSRRKVLGTLLNDANEPLIGLWNRIINHPLELMTTYTRLWEEQTGREREYYDFVRTEFNRTQNPDYLLYLLARCVKASVRYNSEGEFNQSPDNRRRGARPETMSWHVFGASNLLKGIAATLAGDYRQAIEQATSRDIVYLDPPYQGVCEGRDQRYLRGVTYQDFVNALESMIDRGLSFILSYDGRTGEKKYGRLLPASLNLLRIEISAGPSSQATLLGRSVTTYESLYISPRLVERVGLHDSKAQYEAQEQLSLF